MKIIKKGVWVLLAFLALPIHANAYYSVIDLGVGYARCVNNNGQIVGSSGGRAVIFDSTGNGNNTDLGAGVAHSINDNGQIVGEAGSHPMFFDSSGNGNNITLSTGEGGAYSINNNGQIVGMNNFRAVLFDNTGRGMNIELGTNAAYSINDNGQIVGSRVGGPILYDSSGNGNNIALANVIGAAYSINNNGQIVGQAADAYGYFYATLFDFMETGNNINLGCIGGTPHGLLCSRANSINENGQIVGVAWSLESGQRATLFDTTGEGNNIDLNTLINPASGWVLRNAYCINNDGWIVGEGMYYGQTHAFLLIIPEPMSILLFGFGLLALRKQK